MWVAASEDRREILGTYEAATAHADETIRSLDLDALGHVPWWPRPNVTLHAVLVHVVTETARHAGPRHFRVDGSARPTPIPVGRLAYWSGDAGHWTVIPRGAATSDH